MKNKKKIISITIIFICILTCTIYFWINQGKILKSGNNKSSQEIVNSILNISSYEVKATIEIRSNKNENYYVLKQTYTNPNQNSQEIIEPSSIEGIKISREGNNLKIENSNLSLTRIFENYQYIGDNCLDLSSFIEDYKGNSESSYQEKSGEILMETVSNSKNKYQKYKKLIIDKETQLPKRLEIKDDNKNTRVYILYNEVKINNIGKDNILAFRLYDFVDNI